MASTNTRLAVRQSQEDRPWITPANSSRRLGLAGIGLLLFIIFSLSYDNFFAIDNVRAIAVNMSSIAIAAVGTKLLIVCGQVDLSIGSQFAVVGVTAGLVARDTQNAVLAVVTAIIVGGVLGAINGLLVRFLSISPLIVTLGTLAIYGGLAYAVSGGDPVFGFPTAFSDIGSLSPFGVPMPVLAAAVIFLLGALFLLRTVAGLRLYGIGGNREAARRLGINTSRTVLTVFAANGIIIGVVAVLAVARLSSATPQLGNNFELDVLTAVILGGFAFNGGSGHSLGVLFGVVTIGILNAGLIFAGLPDFYQQIAKGALLLLALASDQILAALARRRRNGSNPESREPIAGFLDVDKLLADRHPGKVLLEVAGITVQYGNIQAVQDASMVVREGEVVCLLGDNGAGKSTFIKVISGVVRPVSGELRLENREISFDSPHRARAAGIETVYQDLALCANLGVAHNLVLGDEPRRKWFGIQGFRDDRAAARIARDRLAALRVPVTDLRRPISSYSGGQSQSVAIARALKDGVKIVVMDEPTAALGVAQTAQVLSLIAETARAGHGVVLITHDVEQVLAISDRVVVMRLGRVIHDGPSSELKPLKLIELMAGFADREANDNGQAVLENAQHEGKPDAGADGLSSTIGQTGSQS